MGGGGDLPPQPLNPIFLKILPYYHILLFIDFSCMAIIFARIDDFSIISQGYNFYGRGLCFWILTLYIHDKAPVKK